MAAKDLAGNRGGAIPQRFHFHRKTDRDTAFEWDLMTTWLVDGDSSFATSEKTLQVMPQPTARASK